MTKKDYVLIAGAIAETMQNVSAVEANALDGLITALSRRFKADNARFDAARFRAAAWCEGDVKGYDMRNTFTS